MNMISSLSRGPAGEAPQAPGETMPLLRQSLPIALRRPYLILPA